jgi:hypothetical protein
MNLKKKFRDKDFDFIDSTGRSHEVYQLWLKKDVDAIENTSDLLSDVFESYDEHNKEVVLSKPEKDDGLSVNYEDKQTYKSKIGLSVLGDLLKKTGLGKLGATLEIKGVKEVKVSYQNTKTYLASYSELTRFLYNADLKHFNPVFAKHLKRNNLIVISGIATATDLKITMEFSKEIKAALELAIKEAADLDVDFSFTSDKSLEMKSEGNKAFPIAVKAHRIIWGDIKDELKELKLISDNRNLF